MADLTQEELAEKAKVSLKYLQRIERGENFTVRSLVKFTNALGVSILELFVPPRTWPRCALDPFPRAIPFDLQRWWIQHLDPAQLLTARLEELMAKQSVDLTALQQKSVEEVFTGL